MKIQVSLNVLDYVDEGASVHYVEGCTAPTYSAIASMQRLLRSLPWMVLICATPSKTGLTMSITWSPNGAKAQKMPQLSGSMGTLGAKTTMKYPSVYLDGEGARGTMLSIAFCECRATPRYRCQDDPQCTSH